jgi:hypothetical protein
LLIETIAAHVHSIVKELEAAGDTSSPGYQDLKQYASELDLYKSVRMTPEGDQYGLALLDRLLAMGRYVDRNIHSLHSILLVSFLEERMETMNVPSYRGRGVHN